MSESKDAVNVEEKTSVKSKGELILSAVSINKIFLIGSTSSAMMLETISTSRSEVNCTLIKVIYAHVVSLLSKTNRFIYYNPSCRLN